MPQLKTEIVELIGKYFKEIPEHETFFAGAIENRKRHKETIENTLSKEKLDQMSEVSFSELISDLWASGLWGNKDYLVQNIIQSNGGIENIKKKFINLLYGKKPFEERFDEFDVKNIGPASITEILCMFSPDKYGIWNINTRNGLRVLTYTDPPFTKYRITGKDYNLINSVMGYVADELRKLGMTNVDMLTVDYFLYKVSELGDVGKTKSQPDKVSIEFDHDEVRDYLRDIGNILGFEAVTEYTVATGAKVDTMWSAKIGNLGSIRYVFEVQMGGSIDSLILNLQRARSNQTVQRVVAVSDAKQLEKIKAEVETLPEEFRKSLVFWDQQDVVKTYEMLFKAQELMAELGLTKAPFEK